MNLQCIARGSLDLPPTEMRLVVNSEGLQDLALSMYDLGQLQPIIVVKTGERFRVVDGCRRKRAADKLDWPTLQAIVLDEDPDHASLPLIELVANCLRVDLNPLERAQRYAQLKAERNWTNSQLADALRVSRASVTFCLSHLKLPAEAQAHVASGELPASTAYALSRLEHGEQQTALLRAAVHGELNRDEARELSGGGANGRKRARTVCRLAGHTVTVVSDEAADLAALIALWQHLLRECRRAQGQGLDWAGWQQRLDRERQAARKRRGRAKRRGTSATTRSQTDERP